MKQVISLCFALVLAVQVQAKNISWMIGGGAHDYMKSVEMIAHDNAGHIYIAGYFQNNLSLGASTLPPITGTGQGDGYLAKMDTNSTVIWIKHIPYIGNSGITAMTVDPYGNCFLACSFKDSIVIDGTTIHSTSLADACLAKFNPSGTVQWVKHIKGADYEGFSCLAANQNGDIYAGGVFTGNTDFGDGNIVTNLLYADICICKYDGNGNIIWKKTIQSLQEEQVYSLTVSPAGDLYACGTFTGQVLFDGISQTSLDDTSDGFIVKYTSNGTQQWVKAFGSTGIDKFSQVSFAGNNLYLSGFFRKNIQVGSVSLSPLPANDFTSLLAKFDVNGNVSWARSYEGIGEKIKAHNGTVYIAGVFMDSLAIGGLSIQAATGQYDFYVGAFDDNGNIKNLYKGGAYMFEYLNGLDVDDNSTVYIGGNTMSDSIVFNTNVLQTTNGDLFLAKFKMGVQLNIPQVAPEDNISIYPNPASDRLYWSAPDNVRVNGVMVYDIKGSLLLYAETGKTSYTDISSLPPGMYRVQLHTGYGVVNKIMVK